MIHCVVLAKLKLVYYICRFFSHIYASVTHLITDVAADDSPDMRQWLVSSSDESESSDTDTDTDIDSTDNKSW